jgi:hypothetical protein
MAEVIKVNSSLQEIRLCLNGISARGIKLIAEALKENSALQDISLESTEFGDE